MRVASVLIIEDDPALLRGLKDNFQAQNYQVQTARDGREGLAVALSSPPDLILLDIMLPRMNGYEICRAVRAKRLEMPIIMLTAKGQEEDIVRGLELGADDYMTKPFSIRELLARVRAFLRRWQTVPDVVFHFGDCKLDLSAHKLFRNGRDVVLTTKEFRLLEFFANRPGRALTRDQILDGVWGNDIIVNDRSVDRCVTTLRAKIELDPHRPACIKTIRDIGYRFEPDS
jgi:DNA-binding response OmpR family regulator